jgi:hypothetical protein
MVYPYSGGSGTLQKRFLEITFAYAAVSANTGNPTAQSGLAGHTTNNLLTVTGPRASANISHAGGAANFAADLRLYGLTQQHMAQLTMSDGYISVSKGNTVTIAAGIVGATPSIIYSGNINSAVPDYSAAPDVFFQVESSGPLPIAVTTLAPTSYPGTTDVATAMASLANQVGATFQNGNVQVHISNPYLWGSPLSQIRQLAEMANINFVYDCSTSPATLAIWPIGGSRPGAPIVVSPDTGLVGYPKLQPLGVEFTMLFNPSVKIGSIIALTSSIKPATGNWEVASVSHILESETPGGAWFTKVTAVKIGLVVRTS